MARRIYISVASWQLLASVPLLYCLVSTNWIISADQEETRGLFYLCHKGNSTCNETVNCAPCHVNATEVKCTDFGDDPQGLDREIVGGMLATVLLSRGIVFVMAFVSAIAGRDGPRGSHKGDLPYHVILLEEISGAADGIGIAIYLVYNNVLLIDNPCRTYGVGFWLNFIRPAVGVIYLRLLHPAFMSVTNSYLRNQRKSDHEDSKPLTDDGPGVLVHHPDGINEEAC